jgi:hypothetical protein
MELFGFISFAKSLLIAVYKITLLRADPCAVLPRGKGYPAVLAA